jgi:hypothetical protein
MADFDPTTDYMKEIDSEDRAEENGREYPYLRGLKKLAHAHRKGIKAVRSKIVKTPSVGLSGEVKGEKPDCIASVTISYEFNDGTIFEGSADASYLAHKAPFNFHLVAIAESKAEARAIRRAFNISAVAKEEMGQPQEATKAEKEEAKEEADKMKGPITDVQVEGIKRIAKRKKLLQAEVVSKVRKGTEGGNISDLTYEEGLAALKYVNKYKPKG